MPARETGGVGGGRYEKWQTFGSDSEVREARDSRFPGNADALRNFRPDAPPTNSRKTSCEVSLPRARARPRAPTLVGRRACWRMQLPNSFTRMFRIYRWRDKVLPWKFNVLAALPTECSSVRNLAGYFTRTIHGTRSRILRRAFKQSCRNFSRTFIHLEV